MNYNNYNYFMSKEYIKLRDIKKEFELTSEKMVFTFFGPDGKMVVERKSMTRKEYNDLSDGDKYKFNSWNLSRDYINNWRDKMSEFSKNEGEYILNFKKKAPTLFISDFSIENNIDNLLTENILKYTFNNINYTAEIMMDSEDDSYCPYWEKDATFENFMSGDKMFYENDFEKLDKIMKNNLDFLRLSKGL